MILFLKPYFSQKPWAGKESNKIYDCPDNTGEAWIVSGYLNKSSVITNGRFKGQTLRHVWNKHPELFGNFPDKEFPLLIKLISSSENLSVQVHPMMIMQDNLINLVSLNVGIFYLKPKRKTL